VAEFFVDENDLALGKALAELNPGLVVFPGHADLPEVPRGAIDDEWLPIIGVKNLVVITRDQRIRYRPVEKRMWVDHRVRGFVLTGRKSQSTGDSLRLIQDHWLRIIGIVADKPKGPWMYALTQAPLREIDLD
jgi:hypothetical protein